MVKHYVTNWQRIRKREEALLRKAAGEGGDEFDAFRAMFGVPEVDLISLV